MPALLQVTKLHKSYGPVTILDEVTASFSTEQKIGCIGRNGAGKSTLCKIVTGHEEADSGSVSRSSDLRLSYLEQHDVFRLDETPLQFLERYTGVEEWRCGEMAGKFRLKNDILTAPMSSLPGGYRTRVKLAAMLLQDPNFLILDEPTNYLDLATLILLENFLREFNGGFIIVSHDREFLKKTCDHTLEVENGRLSLYPGSIEEYFEFVLASAVFGASKPNPKIFEAALEKMGAKPAHAVHIGDSLEDDIKGAGRAGIWGIWIDRHGRKGSMPVPHPFNHVPAIGHLGELI